MKKIGTKNKEVTSKSSLLFPIKPLNADSIITKIKEIITIFIDIFLFSNPYLLISIPIAKRGKQSKRKFL